MGPRSVVFFRVGGWVLTLGLYAHHAGANLADRTGRTGDLEDAVLQGGDGHRGTVAGRGGSLGLANVQVGDVVHWAALAGAVQLATGAGGGQHWLSRRGWRAIGHDIYRLVLRAANSIDLPLMSARGEVAVDITEGLIAAIDDREAIGDDRLVWVDVVVCWGRARCSGVAECAEGEGSA